jgi:uncharacterized protein (DUF1501 family)
MPITPVTGNRFLITTYKFGGESMFAKLVPLKNDAFPENSLQKWWDARPAHRYGENGGVFDATIVRAALANKLNTTPDYALHPNYDQIMPVWAEGDLAIVPHCGVMEEPLPDFLRSIPGYLTAYRYPYGIGAHDAFQIHHTFMNGRMLQSSAGWLGKVMDAMASSGVLSVGLSGQHTVLINPGTPHYMMMKGDDVAPYTMPRTGPTGPTSGAPGVPVALLGPLDASTTANLRASALLAAQQAALPGNVRHAAWVKAFEAAVSGGALFNAVQTTNVGAGGPLYVVDAFFGQVSNNVWWKSMFHRIARTIEIALNTASGAPIRMSIGASVGDYDTHNNEKARFEGTAPHTSLASEYGEGLALLREACGPLGLDCWNDVVLTDPTDFGRTLWTNGGDGTDHAWAYAMFIAGGLVRGAGKDGSTGLLGPYPDIISTNATGTRDWNIAGIMYPYRSLEEVYDQILEWFGLTVDERNAIMINRTRFSNFVDVLDI